MNNKSKNRVCMPVENPKDRIESFKEVELGYDKDSAVKEARRCLGCRSGPCVLECPLSVDIPKFISQICENNTVDAYKTIRKSSWFPAICGRICPQEKQCESACVRGKTGEPIAIGRLERYVADCNRELKSEVNAASKPQANNHKIAVVGSGPSGMVCALELAKRGYKVTIFEALHEIGGVLAYGIPKFRLPREVFDYEISKLKEYNIEVINNCVVGKTITIDEMFENGYSAVYIATGAGNPKFPGIKGEGLSGIYSANEFLTRVNLMNVHKAEYDTPLTELGNVVVIGGGNVAADVARCARRLTKGTVTIMYRRGEKEMPARLDEIKHAKEEKIDFKFLSDPVEYFGESGVVKGVIYREMRYDNTIANGRKNVIPKPNSMHKAESDTVIIAIGSMSNTIISGSTFGLECDKYGKIVIKSGFTRTSKPFVYAGGDVVTGSATAILAMEAGKKAALEIFEDLQK